MASSPGAIVTVARPARLSTVRCWRGLGTTENSRGCGHQRTTAGRRNFFFGSLASPSHSQALNANKERPAPAGAYNILNNKTSTCTDANKNITLCWHTHTFTYTDRSKLTESGGTTRRRDTLLPFKRIITGSSRLNKHSRSSHPQVCRLSSSSPLTSGASSTATAAAWHLQPRPTLLRLNKTTGCQLHTWRLVAPTTTPHHSRSSNNRASSPRGYCSATTTSPSSSTSSSSASTAALLHSDTASTDATMADREILPDNFRPQHYDLVLTDLNFADWSYKGIVT